MNADKAGDIVKKLKKDEKVKKIKKVKKDNEVDKAKKDKDIKDSTSAKLDTIKINPKKIKCEFFYYKLEPLNRPPPHDLRLQLQKKFLAIYKNKKIKSIIGPGLYESDEPEGTDINLKYHNYRVVFDNREEVMEYLKECNALDQKFEPKMFNWMKNIEMQEIGDVDLGY